MNPPSAVRFSDQKNGFSQILSDPHWLAKVLLGGFLLINPFLVALAPAYFSVSAPEWVKAVFPWILGFNVLSFWFPLGFTYEVLRRARTGRGTQWRRNDQTRRRPDKPADRPAERTIRARRPMARRRQVVR